MAAKSTLRSIGQVLSGLKGEFPDVSISKIRFLESEGLLAPERAPSGYRRYADDDVQRLRYILTAQRDHYLPLRVIRDHLALLDVGQEPPTIAVSPVGQAGQAGQAGLDSSAATTPDSTAEDNRARTSHPGPPAGTTRPAAERLGDHPVVRSSAANPAGQRSAADDGLPRRVAAGGEKNPARMLPIRLSRADLLKASGLTEATLAELERIQVIQPRRGSRHYGREALALAVAAKRLAVYGIDSRHLRAFKMAADREIGLVEQAIAPHVRRSKNRAELTAEVTQLIVSVHAALVRVGMDR